jgi:hypothetical protein
MKIAAAAMVDRPFGARHPGHPSHGIVSGVWANILQARTPCQIHLPVMCW